MYHSITFTTAGNTVRNTWKTWDTDTDTHINWYLIPTTRPVFAAPTPTYNYVDIPGASGSLDLTKYLTGSDIPVYSDRQGAFEFYVDNTQPGYMGWDAVRSALASFFNGRVLKAKLEDDPTHYYKGRFFLKAWSPDAAFSKVTIEYRVSPYRYNVSDDQEAGL